MEEQNGKNSGSKKRGFLTDISIWTLVASNLIVIFLAIQNRQTPVEVALIYWLQAVYIAFFHGIKILLTRRVLQTPTGLQPVFSELSLSGRILLFLASIVTFGFFSSIYLFFLALSDNFFVVVRQILPLSIVFFAHHLFSFVLHVKTDLHRLKTIGQLFEIPLIRIIPMFFFIVLGTQASCLFDESVVLIFFFVIKTAADILLHAKIHRTEPQKVPAVKHHHQIAISSIQLPVTYVGLAWGIVTLLVGVPIFTVILFGSTWCYEHGIDIKPLFSGW